MHFLESLLDSILWLPFDLCLFTVFIYSLVLLARNTRWKYRYGRTLATIIERNEKERTLDVSFSPPKIGKTSVFALESPEHETPALRALIKLNWFSWRRAAGRTIIPIMYPPDKPAGALLEGSSWSLAACLFMASFIPLVIQFLILASYAAIGSSMMK